MTKEEFESRKRKIMIIAGIGIFALLCSYTIGSVAPTNGLAALGCTAIFIACIFIAGTMAYKLNKESTSK
jgi:hypothetical protein